MIEIVPAGARSKELPHYFADEEQAWEFYRQRAFELGGQSILLAALARYHAHKCEVGQGNPKTRRTADKSCQRVRRFFRQRLDTDLLELRIAHVQRLYDLSKQDDISIVHRNNTLAEAKAFVRWGATKGIVRRSVADRLSEVESVGVKEKGQRKKLRKDEIRQLLLHCLSRFDRFRDLGALAILLAVRLHSRSEDLLQIRVRDVNDRGALIYLPDAKTESGIGYRRLVCEATRKRLMLSVEGKAPRDWVFPSNRTGGHLRWRFLNRAIKRLCKELGIEEINAKQLRASVADFKALREDPLETVAVEMGHSRRSGGAVARNHYVDSTIAANVEALRINEEIGTLSQPPRPRSPRRL